MKSQQVRSTGQANSSMKAMERKQYHLKHVRARAKQDEAKVGNKKQPRKLLLRSLSNAGTLEDKHLNHIKLINNIS
jgi:hypothetical protein